MHAGNARELGFKMRDRAQVRIVDVKITKRAAQEREQFRLVMIALGANLNQFDKVSGSLGAKVIFPDADERIFENDFGQGVQRRFATCYYRNFRFEEKIEFAGEWSFRTAGAFSHGLNAAQRLSTPGNDQTGVAKLAFA